LRPESIALFFASWILVGCPGTNGDTPAGEPPGPDDNLLLSDRFLNIAHRGGGLLAPEATLVAYENAVEVGADVLEMDLHATEDGVVVCMHDAEVDRTTDGSGLIREMTFDELRSLDAGYWFSVDGKTHPYRGQGVVVPTFEEVLVTFPEMHYLVEIKQSTPPIHQDVLDILATTGAADRTVLVSRHQSVMDAIREAAPEQLTAFSIGEIFAFLLLEDEEDYTPPGQFLQGPPEEGALEVITSDFLERADRHGLKVHVWTINDKLEMVELIAMGVDGIMTDDPALLADVLTER